jgi:hypothetical protein
MKRPGIACRASTREFTGGGAQNRTGVEGFADSVCWTFANYSVRIRPASAGYEPWRP